MEEKRGNQKNNQLISIFKIKYFKKEFKQNIFIGS